MAKKRQRRTSTNRYAHLAEAQDELDFHSLGQITPKEIKHETIRFVAKAKSSGHKKIRIITGKGIHSKNGPVVKPQVQRTLRQLERDEEIRSFTAEKASQGGDGAFLVNL